MKRNAIFFAFFFKYAFADSEPKSTYSIKAMFCLHVAVYAYDQMPGTFFFGLAKKASISSIPSLIVEGFIYRGIYKYRLPHCSFMTVSFDGNGRKPLMHPTQISFLKEGIVIFSTISLKQFTVKSVIDAGSSIDLIRVSANAPIPTFSNPSLSCTLFKPTRKKA